MAARWFLALAVAVLMWAWPLLAASTTQVYPVPPGAHPHDVAPAPDGKVWYTAQRQGALGILDPKTDKVRQVPLGEGSAPHGVIQGPDGAAWITDGGLNAIVRFDPKTEERRIANC
jgi:virginiamycin B lyase